MKMLDRYVLVVFVGVLVTYINAEDCANGIGNCTLVDKSNGMLCYDLRTLPRS